MTTDLRRAIDLLSADRCARTEWVYFDDATRRHYVADSDDLRDLGARLRADEPDAYSCWCADTFGVVATAAQKRRAGIAD